MDIGGIPVVAKVTGSPRSCLPQAGAGMTLIIMDADLGIGRFVS